MADKLAKSSENARLENVKALFERSIALKRTVCDAHLEPLLRMADLCVDSLCAGGKLLLCGNGGSAADAQHLAAELLVRLRPDVDRDGIPALALALDSSSMTACGNDYSYEHFYERMTNTLGRAGDVMMGITTSGKSPNVLGALRAARAKGMKTVAFLGGNGGPALPLCDVALVVPSSETGRVQEVHITAGHALMEMIEDGLLERGSIAHLKA